MHILIDQFLFLNDISLLFRKEMLILGVSMSSICGGTGNLKGSETNVAMITIFKEVFPSSPLTIISWLYYAIPQTVICLFVVGIWLQIYYLPCPWKVT